MAPWPYCLFKEKEWAEILLLFINNDSLQNLRVPFSSLQLVFPTLKSTEIKICATIPKKNATNDVNVTPFV